MNGSTSAPTQSNLSFASSSYRWPLQRRNQVTRGPTLPAINTSVPPMSSQINSAPPVRPKPVSYFASLGRQISSRSATSSESSHTNNSLFSRSRETFTTVTSATSTVSSCNESERVQDTTTQPFTPDPSTSGGDERPVKIQDSDQPLSPVESLTSLGEQYVLALHDFTPLAPNATCLSFRAGQIIQVLNRDVSGWWDGELDGRRGWFPSNYVSGLDQVGKLRDEVLFELHKPGGHESIPSLASWTSTTSSSSEPFKLGPAPTKTPVLPAFEAQDAEQLLSEPVPAFSSPDVASSSGFTPTLQSTKAADPQSQPSDVYERDESQDNQTRALSPTISLYRAIAEGDVTSPTLSPTPSLTASRQNHPPLLTPLLHALSLLHRAVSSRRQPHYQPSTACVISCVRSLLTSTECLHRDAPTLRRVPQLAQERKVILGNLATLVSQARRCSDWPGAGAEEGAWNGTAVSEAEVEQQDWELEQMLRMGGEVLRNVTRFLEICEANNVDLPVSRHAFSRTPGSGSSGSERDIQQRLWMDPEVSPTLRPVRPGHSRVASLVRRGGSDGAREAVMGHMSSASSPLDKPAELTPMRAKSLMDIRERRRLQHLERSKQLNSPPLPVATNAVPHLPPRSIVQRQIQQSTKPLSISSMSSLSSGSMDSYGSPAPSPFPSGPCSTAQVLSALRMTHDDLLSVIAAFIGHVHSYGRHSHASSKGHLIELARETVDMVRQLLILVEAVAKHPDVGTTKVGGLLEAKETLFSATNELVEAVRQSTNPTATSDVSEEEERQRTLHGATGVLKVAADCAAAIKICLSRPIGEDPFIICIPNTLSGESAQSQPGTPRLEKSSRPVSYLRHRSISVSSLRGQEQLVLPQHVIGVVTEDAETHPEEDITIQAVDVSIQEEVDIPLDETSPGGSESTVEESDEDSRDTRCGGSGLCSVEDMETRQESSVSSHAKEFSSPFEEKILHGDLPDLPPESPPISPARSLPPLDVDSVYAHLLSHDYDIRDIAYNPEGTIVGATVEVMVEKMTPHDVLVEPTFHQIFMMTWRLFISPPEFVNALIARYNLPAPAALKADDYDIWVKRKATPIKLRVANLIKTWLENFWRKETDDAILTQLSQFVRDTIALQFPGPAQRLLDVIRARLISDDSVVSPRPIDRTRSVDRLREAPVAQPAPVSPSDIPRPAITKALFGTLKSRAYSTVVVTDFDPLELARQFTIMESKLYLVVQPEEVLELGQSGGAPATNVKAISTLSTAITGWVTENILGESDAKKRTSLVKFFIKIADRCSTLNNFSTSRSILAALDSSTISRLHQTWVALPQKSRVQLEALRKIADHARNYSEYRSRLRNTSPPAVPFLGLYLTDVTFCREGNPSHRISPRDPQRKLINFNKYHKLARIVQDMQRFQVPYNLKEIPEVQQYLTAQFDEAKNVGDLQDLYRRSLLVEPRRAADAPLPSGDGKPLLQLWGLGTLSRSQPLITVPKLAQPS